MAATDLVNLSGLMDNAKCFAFVRQHRWPEGVCYPECGSGTVIRDGCGDTQPHQQIAKELGLCGSDVQAMTEQLRLGLIANTPVVDLKGEVEVDEVYVGSVRNLGRYAARWIVWWPKRPSSTAALT